MLSSAFALLLGSSPVEITPARLIDEMTSRHGYGAIVTSASAMPPVPLPDPGNAADVDVRLKNRWRVVRDKTMPGVFRAEAAAYHELFEEERAPSLVRLDVATGRRETLTPLPKSEPLPAIAREDLTRPGGERLTVERLAELSGLKADAIPWIYRRLTVRVRWDPARLPAPLALLSAITGAKIEPGATALAFDPRTFRPLAVATLAEEARRGPRRPVENAKAREAFARYEAARPAVLRLGREAFVRIGEEELRWLYGESSDRTWAVAIPDLGSRETEMIRETLLLEAPGIVQSSAGAPRRRTMDVVGRDAIPKVNLSARSGFGSLALRSRDGSIEIAFDPLGG